MKVPRSVKKQIRSDVKGRVAKMNAVASGPIEKLQNKAIGVKATRALIKEAKGKNPEMKTGGMVNPNKSVSASKVSKGRPAKSAEPKSAAKKATGKVGGISKAPKTATPKSK